MQQRCRMLHGADRLSLQIPLSVLVFHLLLTHPCRGQSQMIGPPRSVVARVGDDIVLPCHLKPAFDVATETLEWKRSDISPRFVNVRRSRQDLENVRNPSYKGRTSLFHDQLKQGNISLKLSKVEPSDQGTYECDIPLLHKKSSVKLVVASDTTPLPVISLAGTDRNRGGVILQCESRGWYPEPEVLWLDGEGKLLSAGPPETVRGPDDLYTVSSRVTVEKRHSNNFTCRVQQKDINQTREAHIHIPDDFFNVQSSSSPTITGLAVSLAVSILLLAFFVWKWRPNMIQTMKSLCDETDGAGRNKQSGSKKEREQLMTDESVQMEVLNEGKGQNKTKQPKKKKSDQQFQEDVQRKQEAENRVKTLKEELKTKKNEVEIKQVELQQLIEEKQRIENEVQSLKEELENKNKELERLQSNRGLLSFLSSNNVEEQQKKKEVERLNQRLETNEKELQMKTNKFADKQSEILQLQAEIQNMETELQILMKELHSSIIQMQRSRPATTRMSSSGIKWPIVPRRKFEDEQQRREKAENEVQMKENELKDRTAELQTEIREKENAQKEVKDLDNKLEAQKNEQAETNRQLQKEEQEKEEAQNEGKDLKNQLETQKKMLERNQAETIKQLQEKEKAQKELKNNFESQKKEFEEKEAKLKQELQEKIKQLEKLKDVLEKR